MKRPSQFRKSLTPVQKRIQQAALRLFVEKGVDRVNVKELAQSAKVARGTIYNNQRASTEQIYNPSNSIAKTVSTPVPRSRMPIPPGSRYFP